MKALVKGHRYVLRSKEGTNNQEVQFIQKEMEENSTELWTVVDGTTNEEVLEMMIDRLTYLQGKLSCKENACAITHIQEALMWLEKRGRDREKRKVEGTMEK